MLQAGSSERRGQLSQLLHPRRRGGQVSCGEVAGSLQAIAEGEPAPGGVVSHVEYCLSCQAELARYHKLLRLLHQLRTNEVAVPPGVVADVLSSLEGAANRRAIRSVLTGRRVAYGSAVLAAGGAATGLVMLTRARAKSPAPARSAH